MTGDRRETEEVPTAPTAPAAEQVQESEESEEEFTLDIEDISDLKKEIDELKAEIHKRGKLGRPAGKKDSEKRVRKAYSTVKAEKKLLNDYVEAKNYIMKYLPLVAETKEGRGPMSKNDPRYNRPKIQFEGKTYYLKVDPDQQTQSVESEPGAPPAAEEEKESREEKKKRRGRPPRKTIEKKDEKPAEKKDEKITQNELYKRELLKLRVPSLFN